MKILGDVAKIAVMKTVILPATVIRIKAVLMVEVDVQTAVMLICAITAAVILTVVMRTEIDKDKEERKRE